MGYDVVVWEGDRPRDDDDLGVILSGIATCYLDVRVGRLQPPSETIAGFVEALLQRWPDIENEGSPWAATVTGSANGPVLSLAIDWSRAAEVAAGVAELAAEYGLQCFGDPATGIPPIFARVTR
ncbi:hypothetical protein [Nocardia heshunensis]